LGLYQMPWRLGALKMFLVITDEPTNGDHYTMPDVIDAVNEAGGTVFAISEDYRSSKPLLVDKETMTPIARADPDEDDVRVLAEETGGIWLDIKSADFSVLIDEVVEYLSSIYTVVYTTSNQVLDGTVRSVLVTVNDPGEGPGWDCDDYEAP